MKNKMSNFEQMPTENSESGKEKTNLHQVVAEKIFSNLEGEKKYGPPNPENYKQAEQAIDELFKAVEWEKNWGKAANLLRKGLVILKIPQDVFTAPIEAAIQDDYPRKERQPFLKALKAEVLKRVSEDKRLWTAKEPFAERLAKIKAEAEELHSSESEISKEE
ncbi:MAG: hypothetical protein A3H57_00375 [Candidatus Taylorbacteria bacterium RIFCSPLOWO2_02_FULL_43_11]|nr:MAG: hypothetical protein A2743_04340 [Candidatus Taylorbacteria bacterium RIFCSPHIGHO2_01_FULL_43_47]OHA29337.1 MAG: hypothetical protein A3B08_04200 [Candidatus Taylorbacteria bacterium RIFCSPLOWO2_01_FULL_43_44]OHA36449.1 MAG: hypothetical protein A3H57_00375 [Candidatus Taylorbacteria bacterium RIFCSPLOWO2_02_FULL_43_11]